MNPIDIWWQIIVVSILKLHHNVAYIIPQCLKHKFFHCIMSQNPLILLLLNHCWLIRVTDRPEVTTEMPTLRACSLEGSFPSPKPHTFLWWGNHVSGNMHMEGFANARLKCNFPCTLLSNLNTNILMAEGTIVFAEIFHHNQCFFCSNLCTTNVYTLSSLISEPKTKAD